VLLLAVSLGGYVGKILDVNLSNGTVNKVPLLEQDVTRFIGGSGIAAKTLYDETGPETDPLGPDNVLCFMTGPITGAHVFSSGRHEVTSKSPLTGIFGESSAGGFFGVFLKKAGFDGIVIRGKASNPVYIWIHDDTAVIRRADHIWGKDTFVTDELIRSETHPKAQVSCIGIAGENMVPLSGIMSEGRRARAAARAGIGAVMGSKNLKAISVYGENSIASCFPEKIRSLNQKLGPDLARNSLPMRRYGTGASLERVESIGDLPIRNWSQGSWEEGASRVGGINIVETMITGKSVCYRCPIGCGKEIVNTMTQYGLLHGRGPEYESLAALGSMLLLDDLEAVCYANELCNRFGIDTISVGGTIAFAMELFEKGIINENDTEGIKLSWGDPRAVHELITLIAHRKGFGEILGHGSREASRQIGKGSEEFAIQVKGMEVAMHDPRARSSLGLAYATSNRGACHLQGQSSIFESRASDPSIGIDEPLAPYGTEGKADLVVKSQSLGSIYDSLCLCRYFRPGMDNVARYYSYVTGMDVGVDGLMEMGHRIFTLKRLYNVRHGITRKDDIIPGRISSLAFPDGGSKGNLPNLGPMLFEYYKIQAWSEDGIPTLKSLRELGLEQQAESLPSYLRRHD
jgi:aldehyde:ferredoxin oxidoreductase